MKIHVLAQKTGLTPPTIRFYEKEGLMDQRHVIRGNNNYRNYTEESVEQPATDQKSTSRRLYYQGNPSHFKRRKRKQT